MGKNHRAGYTHQPRSRSAIERANALGLLGRSKRGRRAQIATEKGKDVSAHR